MRIRYFESLVVEAVTGECQAPLLNTVSAHISKTFVVHRYLRNNT